jgi:site-specific DNA recombinase
VGATDKSLNRIAADHGRCRTRLSRLIGLSCLAPDIITAIVEGRQPATFSAGDLLSVKLPLGWEEQRQLLGFA